MSEEWIPADCIYKHCRGYVFDWRLMTRPSLQDGKVWSCGLEDHHGDITDPPFPRLVDEPFWRGEQLSYYVVERMGDVI